MNKPTKPSMSTRESFAASVSQAVLEASVAASERADKERRATRKQPGADGDGDDDPPRRLHLDKRAESLIAATPEGSDDELLTSMQVANWLGTSPQWVELGRMKGYGPPFMRIAPQTIRYRRNDVVKWLREREFKRVSDYADTGRRKRKAARAEA